MWQRFGKISQTVPPKVMGSGASCADGYRPILDMTECISAGNALNIKPVRDQYMPMFNGLFLNGFLGYPRKFLLFPPANILAPGAAYPGGCLVYPGGNRGNLGNGICKEDVLWFNPTPGGPPTNLKLMICAKV